MHGMDLGPLHICNSCSAVSLCGTPNSRSRRRSRRSRSRRRRMGWKEGRRGEILMQPETFIQTHLVRGRKYLFDNA
jgi:hypothetical protein